MTQGVSCYIIGLIFEWEVYGIKGGGIVTDNTKVSKNTTITFNEALVILGIEEYAERIYNSNSRGELFHLQDYIRLALILKDNDILKQHFTHRFKDFVMFAEQHWNRPESVFQHISKLLDVKN